MSGQRPDRGAGDGIPAGLLLIAALVLIMGFLALSRTAEHPSPDPSPTVSSIERLGMVAAEGAHAGALSR